MSPCATKLAFPGQKEATLPRVLDRETGETSTGHTIAAVYGSMLLQITRDYSGLPDPRTLSMTEIRFFYDGLRPELSKQRKT